MNGILQSLIVALAATFLSITVGTTTAFMFERHEFPGKSLCYMLMLAFGHSASWGFRSLPPPAVSPMASMTC